LFIFLKNSYSYFYLRSFAHATLTATPKILPVFRPVIWINICGTGILPVFCPVIWINICGTGILPVFRQNSWKICFDLGALLLCPLDIIEVIRFKKTA
jgi:hypothetical protein